jgi:hypothetical protein
MPKEQDEHSERANHCTNKQVRSASEFHLAPCGARRLAAEHILSELGRVFPRGT